MTRSLSSNSCREYLEAEGEDMAMVPWEADYLPGEVFVAETFPVLVSLVPGIGGVVEYTWPITRLTADTSVRRIHSNRTARSEKGVTTRMERARERRAQELANYKQELREQRAADLRPVMRNRLITVG